MTKILSILIIPFMSCITKKCWFFVRRKCLHFLQRESFNIILPRKVSACADQNGQICNATVPQFLKSNWIWQCLRFWTDFADNFSPKSVFLFQCINRSIRGNFFRNSNLQWKIAMDTPFAHHHRIPLTTQWCLDNKTPSGCLVKKFFLNVLNWPKTYR